MECLLKPSLLPRAAKPQAPRPLPPILACTVGFWGQEWHLSLVSVSFPASISALCSRACSISPNRRVWASRLPVLSDPASLTAGFTKPLTWNLGTSASLCWIKNGRNGENEVQGFAPLSVLNVSWPPCGCGSCFLLPGRRPSEPCCAVTQCLLSCTLGQGRVGPFLLPTVFEMKA